jgi:UPF0716 protein FxsA
LAWCLLTAVIGSILLRWQGVGLFNKINTEMRANRVPGRELVHGVMILVAGVLLLTPGFVTDSLGFLLVRPGHSRSRLALVKDRIVVQTMSAGFDGRARRPGEADGVVDLGRGRVPAQSRSFIPMVRRDRPPSKAGQAGQGRLKRVVSPVTKC